MLVLFTLLAWLKGLFRTGARPSPARKSDVRGGARERFHATPRPPPLLAPIVEPRAPLPASSGAPTPETAPAGETPARARPRAGGASTQNLDRLGRADVPLASRDAGILSRIDERIRQGKIELPYLPSTSMAVIDLASRPTVEVLAVVEAISTDPVLSSELLKLANSAFYAGAEPIETLQQAVVRIGLRELRSFIFSVSMRGVILREKGFGDLANAVWRQAYSVGSIARAIAPFVVMEPEKAFLLGLLHDIGKIPLLSMLKAEIKRDGEINQALVGKVFHLYHEAAGEAVARTWRLPEEIVSVAGCHHRFQENTEHMRAAALASLAHKLDLYLSLDDDTDYRALVRAPEMDCLKVDEQARRKILDAAERAFMPDMDSLAKAS